MFCCGCFGEKSKLSEHKYMVHEEYRGMCCFVPLLLLALNRHKHNTLLFIDIYYYFVWVWVCSCCPYHMKHFTLIIIKNIIQAVAYINYAPG